MAKYDAQHEDNFMHYWLFKTEPAAYSLNDLKNEPNRRTGWDGIRNYAARNYLRDEVKTGDLVLIYHSVVKPPQVVGVAKVVREAHPDPTAFDPQAKYYDPKSTPEKPVWFMVEIEYVKHFKNPVTLETIKRAPELQEMVLLKNSRLSIQPVRPEEWRIIERLGEGS